MYIFKAAVIGAGAMGAGIAQVISFSGLPVVLKDVDQKFLDKGMDTIRKIYQTRVDKGKMSAGEMDSKMSLVIPALDYAEFGDVDIVIEAVPEKMALKQKIFAELDGVCPEGTIFASNTSALSISRDGARHPAPAQDDRDALFQPGQRDEAGRDHQGRKHRRRDRQRSGRVHRVAAQDSGRREGMSWLSGQSPAHAVPQRGDVVPARGRGLGAGY